MLGLRFPERERTFDERSSNCAGDEFIWPRKKLKKRDKFFTKVAGDCNWKNFFDLRNKTVSDTEQARWLFKLLRQSKDKSVTRSASWRLFGNRIGDGQNAPLQKCGQNHWHRFTFISSSLSNYNTTLSSLSFVKLSVYNNSYSVGIINKVDLLTNIKINLLNKSTSNNYCAIKFIRSAILSDYDGQSLNDFEDKSLNDLTYL